MLKAIIFDWDDVITLGSKDGYYRCYRETLKEFDLVFSDEEFHQRIQRRWGQPFREELHELLLEHPDLLNQAVEIFEKHFWGNSFVDCLKEIYGANEVLVYLAQKYKLAVATGNHPKMLQEKIIPKFRIPNVFAQTITSFDIPSDKTKPNPYMLKILLKDQQLKSEECVYIGDAENDVQMARNAGMEAIVVLTGHLNREQAENLNVKTILPDMTYLKNLL